MADTITEMNRKLDLALARMEEIDEMKEKQKQSWKKASSSLTSLSKF